jgi:PAS domain S-box-containing protein
VAADKDGRRSVRDAILDREAMLTSAQRLAKLGSWAWTVGTDQLWLSPEAFRIFGLEEGEFDGTFSCLLRRIHEDDLAELRTISAQMRHGQRSYSHRYRFRARDGSLKQMRGDSEAQFDERGKVSRLVGTVLDETEHLQIRRAAQDSQDRLRNIEEASHEWFWEQDEQYRFTLVAGGKNRVPIAPAGDVIGLRRWDLPHAVPLLSTWQAHIDGLDARQPFRAFEFRVGEGRSAIVFSASGNPTYDAAGNFRGYKGTALNVTRRIQAEEQARQNKALLETSSRLGEQQLQELSERLTTTLESITDAFFTVDREWRFTYINREAERLLARSREDLLGQVVWQRFPQSLGSTFHRQYERALAERTTVAFEEYSAAMGLWLHVAAYPSVQGLAVYFRDVTESRRIREALVESEERYRMLFKTSVDAILQTMADGRVERANPAACAMFGLAEEQMLKAGRSLIAPDDARLQTMLEERERKGKASGRLTMVRGDGTRFEAEVTSAHFETNGGKAHANVVVRDITQRLAQEQEILALNQDLSERVRQRTAELQVANTELKGFAHSLAHDLRAPIAAIDGFSQQLEASLRAAGAERELHYLQRMRAAARRMDEFIEALLSLANISQAKLQVTEVDLSAMATAILAELHERDLGRRVAAYIQPGMLAHGDARLLRMALENLLGNAWKFTSRCAAPEIRCSSQAGDGGETVFCVEDNGAGFDMAYADKLFGNFQRLHDESEFPGTGIGLANVSRIVARHGGRVWAEGSEGRGAAFHFTLGKSLNEA